MTANIIIRADQPAAFEDRKKIAEAALEAGYDTIVLKKGDEILTEIGRFNALILDGNAVISDRRIGTLVKITCAADMEKAYAVTDPLLILESSDWKVIPLENLISRFQNTQTKIYVTASARSDAELALQTMEVGCDGICILPEDPDFSAFAGLLAADFPAVEFSEAEITAIRPLTLGDRVCIDTCSLMSEGDAMLIGSQSSALFAVCSESFNSVYVNARPFRVNAGAVHSYILSPEGTTQYLSELKSGSQVLVRNHDGSLRAVSVGRIKTEIRPLLLIEAVCGGKPCSVVLQNAETVCISTPAGPKQITKLAQGDKVFVRTESGGRHFGHLMKETITEK